jgi:transcriptional regulator with XRE-family HTH domain
MEKGLPKSASVNSKTVRPTSSHSIWTRTSLLKRLTRNRETREKFVESQISNGIAFQIRALRNRKKWSQPKLAMEIGTTQNQIYRLENPARTRPNISTLKKIAGVFDVALVVQFVSFSNLVDWAAGISPTSLAPPSFEQENQLRLGNIPDEAIAGPADKDALGPILLKAKARHENPSAASQLDKSAA